MSLDSANAAVAVSGEISVQATSDTAPTTLVSALSAADGLGYLSEDGFELGPETSSTDLKGWQNAAILRTMITEAKVTAKFVMVETNLATVALYWGTTITQGVPSGVYNVNPGEMSGRQSFIFDVIDGAEAVRYYFPEGEVTERDPINNQSGELIGYGVTVTFYPSSALSGDTGKVWDSRLKT